LQAREHQNFQSLFDPDSLFKKFFEKPWLDTDTGIFFSGKS